MTSNCALRFLSNIQPSKAPRNENMWLSEHILHLFNCTLSKLLHVHSLVMGIAASCPAHILGCHSPYQNFDIMPAEHYKPLLVYNDCRQN